MSAILESVLDEQRRCDCQANDAAMRVPAPKVRAFLIQIGPRGNPRVSFGCMAHSSAEAFCQHMDLAEVGERVEIVAAGAEPFPIASARHQLAEAQLRERA